MKKLLLTTMCFAWAGSAMALQISIGIRETAVATPTPGPEGAIGSNGGTPSGSGIEWVNLDMATLITDGAWHQYTFDLPTATFTGFAGGTANGILQGNYGTLESIRVKNNGGTNQQITLWIDDVTNTNAAGSTNFGSFESYANGAVARFQRASYSGSTSANIVSGDTVGVDNTTAHSGNNSYKFKWSFIDTNTTRYTRITTAAGGGMLDPNSLIRLDNNAQVSFWAKANVVPEPTTMAALGLGVAALLRRRRK